MRVQRALLAALIAKLSPSVVTVVEVVAKPWASVTFAGTRFEITLLVAGAQAFGMATKFRDTLDCSEFAIPGHIVADVVVANMNVDAASVRLDIEVLTMTDD